MKRKPPIHSMFINQIHITQGIVRPSLFYSLFLVDNVRHYIKLFQDRQVNFALYITFIRRNILFRKLFNVWFFFRLSNLLTFNCQTLQSRSQINFKKAQKHVAYFSFLLHFMLCLNYGLIYHNNILSELFRIFEKVFFLSSSLH